MHFFMIAAFNWLFFVVVHISYPPRFIVCVLDCFSEPPLQSPVGSLTSSASLVSLSSYKPVLVPSAATATLLASAGSLSPRPGPAQAVNTFSQPKM